jgi:hypothetical protein
MPVMFEQELDLEKHESSVVPLLLIVTLIAVMVGVAGYYIWENQQVVSTNVASSLAIAALNAQGPAVIRFHTGLITPSVELKPRDPNYRLLEKAGLLKLGRDKGRSTPVVLTSAGEKGLREIPGVRKTREKDGTDSYVVPIAQCRLLTVGKITMNNARRATVEFTWKWEPNSLGEVFDASGPLVKSFNTWDRATLIDKYGANFYHGEAKKTAITLVKFDHSWKIPEE